MQCTCTSSGLAGINITSPIIIYTKLRHILPSRRDLEELWGHIASIMAKCTQNSIICANIAPRFPMSSGFLIRQGSICTWCSAWDGVERCKFYHKSVKRDYHRAGSQSNAYSPASEHLLQPGKLTSYVCCKYIFSI